MANRKIEASERVTSQHGNVLVKIYNDGAVRVDLKDYPGDMVISQAWLTGSSNKNILVEPKGPES